MRSPKKSSNEFWEKLATTEKTTLVCARARGKNPRHVRLLGRREGHSQDQVLEVGNVDGRLYVARKERFPDEWNPRIAPYGPYGPGELEDA
ncbi:MAG: hypothetical protein WBO12_03245 [Xanthobacteraceae bacterium]